jgi:hypothetical protein
MKKSLLVACVLGTVAPAFARAPAIYINDVRADGIKNTTLSGVDIRFDDNGDIRITAKGYNVTQALPPASPNGGKQYFIATVQPHIGAAQWDIDVFINKTFVHRFRSKDAEPVFEITRYLKTGTNVIHYQATKQAGDRTSTSPNDYLELVVGDGDVHQGKVTVNKMATYRRTAAETGTFTSEANFEATGLNP